LEFQSFEEVQTYFLNALPMYQRVGSAALKPNLDNTIKLCEALGNPQKHFKTIHIAGTNGKGSSSHSIAAVLQTAGYKTGLYTSPHLKHFSERIRINGIEIPEKEVLNFANMTYPYLENLKPSFFEMTVALAFWYFHLQKVEVAVIEVGLGGRLDSTNIIKPILSLITNISWDHVDLLGPTLQHIAAEKAGIIKEKIPVIISEFQQDIIDVFEAKAKELQAPIVVASKIWQINDQGIKDGKREMLIRNQDNEFKLNYSLTGLYQLKNLYGILESLFCLKELGFYVSVDHVQQGLSKVQSLTGLKGRWQTINTLPLTIADTGHNEAGVKEMMTQVSSIKANQLHIIWGMVTDKDHTKILNLLPKSAIFYFTRPLIERGLSAQVLQEKAFLCGLTGEVFCNVNEALKAANSLASENDLILIGGSTFVVSDLDNL